MRSAIAALLQVLSLAALALLLVAGPQRCAPQLVQTAQHCRCSAPGPSCWGLDLILVQPAWRLPNPVRFTAPAASCPLPGLAEAMLQPSKKGQSLAHPCASGVENSSRDAQTHAGSPTQVPPCPRSCNKPGLP